MVVYHGTPTHGQYSNNKYVRSEQHGQEYSQFDSFDTSLSGITDSGWLGVGTYFTPDPDYADEFGNFIIPAYLSIKNPFVVIDDSSSGTSNIFRFLMSIQKFKSLPDKIKLDLSIPEPYSFHSPHIYDGKKQLIKFATVKGSEGKWLLLSGPDAEHGVGVVEGKGQSAEEAIFDYRYRFQSSRFNGFLLHIISKDIGTDIFTKMVKANGYDGVVEYGDESKLKEVVAFYPHQVKSVHNRGTFDSNDSGFMR